MYESPISILYSDIAKRINTTMTDNVVKAVQSYGIHVDEGELMKALDYDRKQYEKGYADAKEEFEKTWIPCSERLPEIEREGQRRGFYLTTNEYGNVTEQAYEFEEEPFGVGWHTSVRIVAWRPLPEAYKGGAV